MRGSSDTPSAEACTGSITFEPTNLTHEQASLKMIGRRVSDLLAGHP
jgi:hypothetical protein